MKVLHVIPSYSLEWGGPPKVVYELTNEISKRGINMDILTTYSDGETLYPVPDGVNLIRYKRGSLSNIWKGYSVKLLWFLIKHLRDYDIVHVHEMWHFPHLVAFLLKGKAKFGITIHGGLDDWCLTVKSIRKDIYSLLFQKSIVNKADFIHVLTETEKQSVIKYTENRIDKDKIAVIPNALRLEDYSNDALDTSITWGRDYILFLGRIHRKKGLDLLVDAFGRICMDKDLNLIIAGPDDGYMDELKEMIDYRKIADRIIFTGMVSGNRKLSLLKNAKLFVLSSYSEGFPVTVIEAMASGCPVIVSDKVGINNELQENRAGIVVETSTVRLEDGIRALLDNEELRKITIKNALKMVSNFYNIETVAEKMIETYARVLNDGYKSISRSIS